MKKLHKRLNHAKKDKMFHEIQKNYYNINEAEVKWFIKHYIQCNKGKIVKLRPPIKAIVTSNPNKRI